MGIQNGMIMLILILLGFIGFVVYFIFKNLQFVIQAINLYKDMVTRQDTMIKLLKDIRDNNGINSGSSLKTARSGSIKHCSKCNKEYKAEYDGSFCESCGGRLE
jgi:hypothetical protein